MSKVFGGRYEVIDRIGAGGMAIVYKAKDLVLNRVVTIKVLREQFGSDEEFIRRFRREAQSAASLSHPNIVSIYDVGKEGDIDYIVMEYVEGRDLKEIIREFAPLSNEQALNLIRQIAEAIRHAHEHHIIHRDIKPHNVLVTADGRAKVTDFGIARAVSSATVTHTGDIVGSVHYLSPEQAKGLQSNEQSDLYSLGIILYELLTGKVPYDGETPIAIALKHLQEPPTIPSKLNPRITPAIEGLILKAIAKSPEKRFQSATEFLNDLAQVRSGQAAFGSPSSPIGEMDDMDATQIHKALRPAINEEVGRTTVGSNKAVKEESNNPRKSRFRKKLWLWIPAAIVFLLILGGGIWLYNYLSVGVTTVPNVVGETLTEAKANLGAAKLTLDPNTGSEYNDKVAKGKIIRQDPTAQAQVKDGREVTVVVSKGSQMLTVPDVITQHLSKDNATYMITNEGFAAGNITYQKAPSSDVPAGDVSDQNPPPNTSWPKNGKINLTISTGPQTQVFNMPNLIGTTAEQAQTQLAQQYNIKVVIQKQASADYPADVVMGSNPQPGDQVNQGATVTLIVSKGPGPIAGVFNSKVLLGSILGALPSLEKRFGGHSRPKKNKTN